MPVRRFSSNRFSPNIWPAFVDMLSALLTVILFAFMMFVVTHFYVQGMLQSRDESLTEMRQKLAALQQAMFSEKTAHSVSEKVLENTRKEKEEALQRKEELSKKILSIQQAMEAAQQAFMTEKSDLQSRLAEQAQALKAAKEELAVLSLKQLKELKSYRSEFFGRLKKALGERKDIRIVGDRFLFQSEVLFDLGKASIGEKGAQELKAFSVALKEVMEKLPQDIDWVLRVDGHTDTLPLRAGSAFSSNLELSVARAVSVVNFLIQEGIPAQRLVAAGFGEFHPVSPDQKGPQDRRIELTLDQKKR